MKKARLLTLALLFNAYLFFSSALGFAQTTVDVTVLNSKGEIQTQLEEIAEHYNRATSGVKVEIVPCPVGQSPFERTMAMYSAGNAPTIAMLDPADVVRFQDKALDLTAEQWVKDAIERSFGQVNLT